MTDSASLYKTIKQRRLYEEVVAQITDLVVRKQLRPGDRLPPERELAEDLGVSRTAVREAVKALEQMGVLEARQGSGTFVRDRSLDAVSGSFSLLLQRGMTRHFELEEVREILDVEVAGRLARRATEEDLRRLDEGLVRMRAALDCPEQFAREDVAFHMAVYRAMGNEVLLIIMQPIVELLREAMRMTVEAPGATVSALRRHEELVARIRARDAQGARRAMQRLISRGEERLREAMLKGSSSVRDGTPPLNTTGVSG